MEEIDRMLDKEPFYSVEQVKSMLATDEKGRPFQSIDNCMLILQHDPVLAQAICYNDLTGKIDITKDLGWGKSDSGGIRDVDENQIEWYMERTYGIRNYPAIGKSLNIIASQNHFHPIKDYLEALEWDGVSRIAEVLPKYLGAEKCAYTTEVMTLLMQAMIHRLYEPGINSTIKMYKQYKVKMYN